MANIDKVLLQKEVDKSVLFQGMSIPGIYHKLFYEGIGIELKHGERKPIKMLLDGLEYDAVLVNQGFDKAKYKDHKDVLQIRYSENSPIASELRHRFANTYKTVKEYRANPQNKNKLLKLEDEEKEYLVIYETPVRGTVMIECITTAEYVEETNSLTKLSEIDFELAIDQNATITIETGVKKVRRLSKAIGNSLKILYGYRCQICGNYIGEQYGSNLIHAHHIDYFTKSLNNNADNIMVVCPNHHGIIHDKNPQFIRETKQYKYPNGYTEGLKLNCHL